MNPGRDPEGGIDFVKWLLSFFDNNKMLTSYYPPGVQHSEMMTTCRESLQELWKMLLNITGGSLELKKCLLTILLFCFKTSFDFSYK